MSDPCAAGLWDIDPAKACPICGALPDTRCKRVKKDSKP